MHVSDNLKEKARHELIEYVVNVAYLSLVFAAFTQYRRFVLAAHGIEYTNYWFALIEALVLGKVIMIGGVFHLGRWLESKPLIYPTVYKAVVFVVLVALFKLVEHGIKILWGGGSLADAFARFSTEDLQVVLANSLVILVAFIPFFAVKELGRVLGGAKLFGLFVHRRTVE